MEYGCVLYSGAAPTYLHRFDTLQTRIEHMSSFTFPSLYNRRSTAILGLVCLLLAGEGRGNLLTFCPTLSPQLLEGHKDFIFMILLTI